MCFLILFTINVIIIYNIFNEGVDFSNNNVLYEVK